MRLAFVAAGFISAAAATTAQNTYDARIIDYTGLRYVCGTASTPVLKIQNAGLATMGTCVVETWKNGLLQSSFNWVLAVPAATGEVRQPALPPVPGLQEDDVLEFRIISVNDQPDEDADGNILSVPMDMIPGQAETYLMNVVVNMSTPPDGLSWGITNAIGQAVAQGGPYTTDGLLEFWVELDPDACYMVRLVESGSKPSGDGQLSIFSNGSSVVDLMAGTDAIPSLAGLSTGQALSVASARRAPLRMWPNPADDAFHIGPLVSAGQLVILRDALGRVALQQAVASTSAQARIDVGALPSGLYTVELIGQRALPAVLIIAH